MKRQSHNTRCLAVAGGGLWSTSFQMFAGNSEPGRLLVLGPQPFAEVRKWAEECWLSTTMLLFLK